MNFENVKAKEIYEKCKNKKNSINQPLFAQRDVSTWVIEGIDCSETIDYANRETLNYDSKGNISISLFMVLQDEELIKSFKTKNQKLCNLHRIRPVVCEDGVNRSVEEVFTDMKINNIYETQCNDELGRVTIHFETI